MLLFVLLLLFSFQALQLFAGLNAIKILVVMGYTEKNLKFCGLNCSVLR